MLIYNRPYIILVATGDRAYVNLHPCAWIILGVYLYILYWQPTQKNKTVTMLHTSRWSCPEWSSHLARLTKYRPCESD